MAANSVKNSSFLLFLSTLVTLCPKAWARAKTPGFSSTVNTDGWVTHANTLCSKYKCCGDLIPQVYPVDSTGFLIEKSDLQLPKPANERVYKYVVATRRFWGEAVSVNGRVKYEIGSSRTRMVLWNPNIRPGTEFFQRELVKGIQHTVCNETMSSGAFIPYVAEVANVGREGIERLLYDPTIFDSDPDRPDLILIDKYEAAPLKQQGILADLRPLIQSKLLDKSAPFLDILLQRATAPTVYQYFQESQTSFFALPLALSYNHIKYNKTTFARLGIQAPDFPHFTSVHETAGMFQKMTEWPYTWGDLVNWTKIIAEDAKENRVEAAGLDYDPGYMNEERIFHGLVSSSYVQTSAGEKPHFRCALNTPEIISRLNSTLLPLISSGLIGPRTLKTISGDQLFSDWKRAWPEPPPSETPKPAFSTFTLPDDVEGKLWGMRFASFDTPGVSGDDIGRMFPPRGADGSYHINIHGLSVGRTQRNTTLTVNTLLNFVDLRLPYLLNMAMSLDSLPSMVFENCAEPPYFNTTEWWGAQCSMNSAVRAFKELFTAPERYYFVQRGNHWRSLLFSLAATNASVDEAVQSACLVVDRFFLLPCTVERDLVMTAGSCDPITNSIQVTFAWKSFPNSQQTNSATNGDIACYMGPNTTLPAPQTLSCGYVSPQSPLAIGIYFMESLGMIVVIGCLISVFVLRKNPRLDSFEPPLLLVVLTGCGMALASTMLLPSPGLICPTLTSLWLFSIGATILLSAFIIRMLQVAHMSQTAYMHEHSLDSIPTVKSILPLEKFMKKPVYLLLIGATVAIDVILLIVVTLTGGVSYDLRPVTVRAVGAIPTDAASFTLDAKFLSVNLEQSPVLLVLCAWHVVLLLAAAITGGLNTGFTGRQRRELGILFLLCLNLTVLVGCMVPFLLLSSNLPMKMLVFSGTVLFAVTTIVVWYYLPRIVISIDSSRFLGLRKWAIDLIDPRNSNSSPTNDCIYLRSGNHNYREPAVIRNARSDSQAMVVGLKPRQPNSSEVRKSLTELQDRKILAAARVQRFRESLAQMEKREIDLKGWAGVTAIGDEE